MRADHGGRIHEEADRIGIRPEDLLDFSANINPLGPIGPPNGMMDVGQSSEDTAVPA